MKNRLQTQLKTWASLTIALSFSLLPREAQAVQRPPERTVVGVVESVDPTTSSLILKAARPSAPSTSMKLGLRTQTVIRSRDGNRSTVAQLTPGATVEVRYRTHLLGIPQSSRIVLR